MNEPTDLRFEWTCPYCGFVNKGYAELKDHYGTMETRLVYCEKDEGGCDKQVALQPKARVTVTVFKLQEVK
jgi:hypothetical protein